MQTTVSSSARNTALTRCPPGLQSLVRKLIAQSRTDAPEPSKSLPFPTQEEVIIDAEVDGIRCLLLRPHSSSAQQITLSPREQEIARMIAKGFPNKAIADVLEISPWTVSTHLRRMFAKLGVSSRAAMVARLAQDPTPHGS